MGSHATSLLYLDVGVPHGCELNALLYFLLTYDSAAKHNSNVIIKFADEMAIPGPHHKHRWAGPQRRRWRYWPASTRKTISLSALVKLKRWLCTTGDRRGMDTTSFSYMYLVLYFISFYLYFKTSALIAELTCFLIQHLSLYCWPCVNGYCIARGKRAGRFRAIMEDDTTQLHTHFFFGSSLTHSSCSHSKQTDTNNYEKNIHWENSTQIKFQSRKIQPTVFPSYHNRESTPKEISVK